MRLLHEQAKYDQALVVLGLLAVSFESPRAFPHREFHEVGGHVADVLDLCKPFLGYIFVAELLEAEDGCLDDLAPWR
jgi:hypothetical protein